MQRKFKHGELSSNMNIGGIKFGNELDPNVNLWLLVLKLDILKVDKVSH